MKFKTFFPTLIYQSELFGAELFKASPAGRKIRGELLRELRRETSILRKIDLDGIAWSAKNYVDGFTTYGSMDQLHRSSPTFGELEKKIDRHVASFTRKQNWDLGGGSLTMSSCWVNVMPKGTAHSMHLHPLSVVSGTFYVSVPKGSSPIKFEDPRLDRFMAQPPRTAVSKLQPFVTLEPKEGEVILFESWLRHEVARIDDKVKTDRVSVSFNYDWV